MTDMMARMKNRVDILTMTAGVLSKSNPILARKLSVLATNPGPPEHFQKLALELLAEAQRDEVSLLVTLNRVSLAMFKDEHAEAAVRLLQQEMGQLNLF